LWWAQLCPRLAQHRLGFAHLAVMSMVVSVFCCVCGLLRRFFYPILDPLAFVPNTFYTHNLSKHGLFQSRSQYGLFQNPGLHTCFGLNLNRGWNKTNAFASKPSFTQRAVLHENCVIHKHNVLRKNHVFAEPVQGCLDSSFHGGRRNTPKAVKLHLKLLVGP